MFKEAGKLYVICAESGVDSKLQIRCVDEKLVMMKN